MDANYKKLFAKIVKEFGVAFTYDDPNDEYDLYPLDAVEGVAIAGSGETWTNAAADLVDKVAEKTDFFEPDLPDCMNTPDNRPDDGQGVVVYTKPTHTYDPGDNVQSGRYQAGNGKVKYNARGKGPVFVDWKNVIGWMPSEFKEFGE